MFVCKRVLYYSHRVSTQLQLTNNIYIYTSIPRKRAELCSMKSQLHLSARKTASIQVQFKQHYTLEQFRWLSFVPM